MLTKQSLINTRNRGASAMAGLATLVATSSAALAESSAEVGVGKAVKEDNQTADIFGNGGIFQTVVDFLLFLVGAISVIMLIVGGIRYILSAGDQQKVTDAKNTILYAIIGIIIAVLAWAIVHFLLGWLYSGEAAITT